MDAFNVAYDFSGKTVLITGGATGIGFATAQYFGESHANIILVDKDIRVKERALELKESTGTKLFGIEADLTDITSFSDIKRESLAMFPQVDILVNNAGIALLDEAKVISKDYWDSTLAINLTAPFFLAQIFAEEMILRKKGKIINLASQAGVIALDKHAAYCVSKAGIISMTKVLALEWGKYNINVNAVSPTVVLTELGKKAWAGQSGENMKHKIPIGRFAIPKEISATILFLASDASDMIHGENILIDGGYSIQ